MLFDDGDDLARGFLHGPLPKFGDGLPLPAVNHANPWKLPRDSLGVFGRPAGYDNHFRAERRRLSL
jgi:hypothetical protein